MHTITKLESKPEIAVIIPLYKHSVLVNEAIHSALRQQGIEVRIVIINDGCPYPESHITITAYTAIYKDKLFNINKNNGGLSSARNAGIEFVLTTFPQVQAIYFLDADNRLHVNALLKAWRAIEHEPKVGWAYPDIDMFSVQQSVSYRGEYRLLHHLHENICEAGSLVKMEVFKQGVRFDEVMRYGFEDWEFWWQSAAKGFRGRYVANMGLQYRKHPESMLRESVRDSARTIAYMQEKHDHLFTPQHLLNLEQQEAPRYVIRTLGSEQFVLTTDPACAGITLNKDVYIRSFMESYSNVGCQYMPHYLIYCTEYTLAFLSDVKIVHWLFWFMENQLDAGLDLICVSLDNNGDNNLRVKLLKEGATNKAFLVATHMTHFREMVKTDDMDWMRVLVTGYSEINRRQHIEIEVPGNLKAVPPAAGAVNALISDIFLLKAVKQPWHTAQANDWRYAGLTAKAELRCIVREKLQVETVYPLVRQWNNHIGFVLPICHFGGVEKVKINLARKLRKLGWKTHLFIFVRDEYEVFDFANLASAFDSINFLTNGREYYTTEETCWDVNTTDWMLHGNHKRSLGLLCMMNIIIHANIDVLTILAPLRRLGVKIVAYMHPFDKTPEGDDAGYPYLNLSNGHVNDLYFISSEKMAHWCNGMGIPGYKIKMIPNAPSSELQENYIEDVFKERSKRRASCKIRVLLLDRIGKQKDTGRLSFILNQSTNNQDIQWRVLVDKDIQEGIDCDETMREFDVNNYYSVVNDMKGLTDCLRWADVLVVSSYNEDESTSLVLMDAMQMGVVPLIVEVGANTELLESDVNGFVFKNYNNEVLIKLMLETIDVLIKDKNKLYEMALRAHMRVIPYSWDGSAKIADLAIKSVMATEIN